MRPVVFGGRRVAYVPIPKVACTSIKLLIADLEGVAYDRTHPGTVHRAPLPTMNLTTHSCITTFAFVRNPWDRLVSCYLSKIAGNTMMPWFAEHPSGLFHHRMPFDEFVAAVAEIPDDEADAHIRSQYMFLSNATGGWIVDEIGSFEHFQRDLVRILGRVGIHIKSVPHAGKTPRRAHYRTYYTDETRRTVARRYATDIALLGYAFDEEAEERLSL